MAGPLLKVEGASQLRQAIKKANGELADLKDLNQTIATLVTTAAARNAPRKTGKLAFAHKPSATRTRASVTVGANVRGAGTGAVLAELGVGRAVPYAGAIHWGWPGSSQKLPKQIRGKIDRQFFIAPNPWIVDTGRQLEPTWVAIYSRGINEIIDAIGPETNKAS